MFRSNYNVRLAGFVGVVTVIGELRRLSCNRHVTNIDVIFTGIGIAMITLTEPEPSVKISRSWLSQTAVTAGTIKQFLRTGAWNGKYASKIARGVKGWYLSSDGCLKVEFFD
jgi:hypothetical protein